MVVPECLVNVVLRDQGGIDGVKKKIVEVEKKPCAWSELNEIEQKILHKALDYFAISGEPDISDQLDIFESPSRTVLGRFEKGRIFGGYFVVVFAKP